MTVSEVPPKSSLAVEQSPNGVETHGTVRVHGEAAPQHARARTLGPWFIVGLIVVVVAAVGLVKARKPPAVAVDGAAPPVVTVSAWRVVEREIPRTLTVTGSISAWDPLPIGAAANGLRIDQVNVEEGDRVRKGQVMAALDSSVLRAQRRQLEARLQSARAAVPKAVQPNRPQEIESLRSALLQAEQNAHQQEANLLQARANYDNAKKNHVRYQQLLAQGYVTTKEYEDRQTELDRTLALQQSADDGVRAARFQVEQARQRLALAQAGGRSEDVSIARASGDEVAALIQQVDAQIEQTLVRAPDDGLVIKRDAHIGDISSPTKTLFVLVRRNQLELRAQMPEVDLPDIRVGQRVRLTVAAAPTTPAAESPAGALEGDRSATRPIDGKVWLINPQIDPQTRLGTVRIAIPSGRGLVPGMFVRAEIDCGREKALLVPVRAVLGSSEDRFVFLLDGDKVRRRAVRTEAVEGGGCVQVSSGLQPGNQVVVDGGGFLTDGDTVKVGPPATLEAPSPTPSASGASGAPAAASSGTRNSDGRPSPSSTSGEK